MFDALALASVLHLAVLAGGPRAGRLAWVTAIPQAALLVFLYHARSSLGWQYLALFALTAARVGWWAVARLRSAGPADFTPARPLFVAVLLVLSLAGLKQYQRATYHPDYLAEHGRRTFWHNALMGLAYQPDLRDRLPMRYCDDRDAADLVLGRMAERDPDLDRGTWNARAALNSLGNHNPFDWDSYEAAARDLYLELWRDDPARMAACYAYHKPAAIAGQAALLGRQLGADVANGQAAEFLAGLILALAALAVVTAVARRDGEFRAWSRSLMVVVAFVLPFSLIPGVAFYPALPTVACFYVLAGVLLGLVVVSAAAHSSSKSR
jgi:hypothetical protein